MAKVFDTLLLLALPASGKSEVRRFLEHVPADECERDFHIGGAVQLDDFPYVHFMRCIDDELERAGRPRLYFKGAESNFIDPYDWGTLIHLINEDYDELVRGRPEQPSSYALHLFDRLERAAAAVGCTPRLATLDDGIRGQIADKLEREAREHHQALAALRPDSLKDKTVVIEFARGGPDGSKMPLPAPMGYRFSLAQLSDSILATAAILYVWVTPEESRRKNAARANPDDPGSILHHGVPMDVMLNDYGCDDIDDLLRSSSVEGTIEVARGANTYHLPLVRFDNRVDMTSFLRADPADWPQKEVQAITDAMSAACQSAYKIYASR